MGGGENNNSENVLDVRVTPSCEYALNGVANSLYVLVQLKTGIKKDAQDRAPFDLAIVLDRSGSMNGDSIENSKTAICKVIENLTSNDKLHFVIYDTNVDTVFEDGNLRSKETLIEQVKAVKVAGSTNLHGGLQRGYELLKKHGAPGRTKRIFLFSDGLVNVGIQEPSKIYEHVTAFAKDGITITSFGIGASFDEELMKGISEYGKGSYFYIADADSIEKFVAKGLKSLLGLIGTNALLKFRGKNGAIVKKVFAHDDLIGGCKIGDLKQDNLRQVVAQVEVSPNGGAGNEVLTWELTYDSPDQPPQKITLNGVIAIKYTDDDKLVANVDPVVKIGLTIQEMGDSDLVVMKLIDENKIAEALQMKEKELVTLVSLEPLDTTGIITALRQKTERTIEGLKSKKDVAAVRKEVHHGWYSKRRNSVCEMID